MDSDPDPYLWLMDPDADTGGPKTYGPYGSESTTLNFIRNKSFCTCSQNSTMETSQLEESQTEEPAKKKKKKKKDAEEEGEAPVANGHDLR